MLNKCVVSGTIALAFPSYENALCRGSMFLSKIMIYSIIMKMQEPVPKISVLVFAVIILSIVGLGFAIYANSFRNEFIFDDVVQIVKNTAIRSFSNLPAVFTHHLTYFTSEPVSGFFRPIQTVSLMADHYLWGMNVMGYHLTNTLIHIINCILIFYMLWLITRNIFVSSFSAFLYLTTPVHTEAVTYISGRADLLCTMFFLVMVILQNRYWRSRKLPAKATYYIFICISFIFASLSKEMAVLFPFLLILCEYCFRGEKTYCGVFNKKFLFYVPLFLITAIWFVYKNHYVPTEALVAQLKPLGVRVITVPRIVFDYIKISFLPMDLHMEYKFPLPRSIFDPAYFVYFFFLAFFMFILSSVWRRGKTSEGCRIIFFGLAWFIVGLFPYLNVAFEINSLFAEHWLYVPEIGLLLSVVYSIFRYWGAREPGRKIATASLTAVVIIFSFMTVKQNTVWKNGFTFFTHTIRYTPSAQSYNMLAGEYMKRGDIKQTKEMLKKAIELEPDFEKARNNLRLLEGGEQGK